MQSKQPYNKHISMDIKIHTAKIIIMPLSRKILIRIATGFLAFAIIGTNVWIFSPYIFPENYTPATYQINGNKVNDICYLLQFDEFDSKQATIEAISRANHDIFILEAFYDQSVWSSNELTQMKENNHTQLIFAYMSIGEAETYRHYWNTTWDSDKNGMPDPEAPSWLDMENPEWEGNYKVKFWEEEWQQLIFGNPESYLDLLLSASFDGVYLDIIDAYEYYQEKGISNAGQLMVEFVGNLSVYAKQKVPSFQIIPQNGESLVLVDGYLEFIDGLGREDLIYDGNSPQDPEEIVYTMQLLQFYSNTGKYIFQFEYATLPNRIQNVYQFAQNSGFICYNGPRELDKIQEYPFALPN